MGEPAWPGTEEARGGCPAALTTKLTFQKPAVVKPADFPWQPPPQYPWVELQNLHLEGPPLEGDELDPEEKENLEEEAAKYEAERYYPDEFSP